MIYDWSLRAFAHINAVPEHLGVLMAAKIVSSWPLILIFTLIAALLIARAKRRRGPLVLALGAVVVAMIANISIGHAMPMPRPFVLGMGQQLLAHAPTPSFPSNHATFLLALAFGLWWTRASLFAAVLAFLLALATSWSRIYLGVHFPIDILGSLVVAALAAAPFGWLAGLIRRRVRAAEAEAAAEFAAVPPDPAGS